MVCEAHPKKIVMNESKKWSAFTVQWHSSLLVVSYPIIQMQRTSISSG